MTTPLEPSRRARTNEQMRGGHLFYFGRPEKEKVVPPPKTCLFMAMVAGALAMERWQRERLLRREDVDGSGVVGEEGG